MNTLKRQFGIAVVLIVGALFAGAACANTIVMNFDQFPGSGEYVENYYNGGCGSSYNGGPVTCGGPNYGVVWSQAIACGAPVGCAGNTANEPSPPNIMGFIGTSAAFMNLAAGFTTGFSFYYAAPVYGGSINVYSGLNGLGTLLTTLNLPTNGAFCDGSSKRYSCWTPIGVTFSGTARSVAFGGVGDYITFDNVTLGSGTPVGSVPEPTELGMFGLGMLLIGAFAGLRRRVG